MENMYLLIIVGLLVGIIGTMIGAGGGFILVPFLILFYGDFDPETITAISMAVVAGNAISGTIAYIRERRVDFKAGIIFAIFTIPGSILGVLTTKAIPREIFDIIFGILLLSLSAFLFMRGGKKMPDIRTGEIHKGWVSQHITDRSGITYDYGYDMRKGSLLSILVGYFSPIFGIGGGIIHVPAMTEWLRFPVHIATATSHLVLAIMAIVSVVTHYYSGSYDNPMVVNMTLLLLVGVVPGAQIGAKLSKKIGGKLIIKLLSVTLGIVGIRILMSQF